MYGRAVGVDVNQAVQLLERACAVDDQLACDELVRHGHTMPADLSAIRAHYQRPCEVSGYGPACRAVETISAKMR
jgi:TPR repeat protein